MSADQNSGEALHGAVCGRDPATKQAAPAGTSTAAPAPSGKSAIAEVAADDAARTRVAGLQDHHVKAGAKPARRETADQTDQAGAGQLRADLLNHAQAAPTEPVVTPAAVVEVATGQTQVPQRKVLSPADMMRRGAVAGNTPVPASASSSAAGQQVTSENRTAVQPGPAPVLSVVHSASQSFRDAQPSDASQLTVSVTASPDAGGQAPLAGGLPTVAAARTVTELPASPRAEHTELQSPSSSGAMATPTAETQSASRPGAPHLEMRVNDASLGTLRVQASLDHAGVVHVDVSGRTTDANAALNQLAPLLHAAAAQGSAHTISGAAIQTATVTASPDTGNGVAFSLRSDTGTGTAGGSAGGSYSGAAEQERSNSNGPDQQSARGVTWPDNTTAAASGATKTGNNIAWNAAPTSNSRLSVRI